MKKTVIYNFPDNFKFPEVFEPKDCNGCPFYISDDIVGMDGETGCQLTGDAYFRCFHECPFLGGAEIVNYDDCRNK